MSDYMYKSFGIITPNNQDEHKISIRKDEVKFSKSALSFKWILEDMFNLEMDVFDKDTKMNILKNSFYYENLNDEEKKSLVIQKIEQFIDYIIDDEMQAGEIHPKCYSYNNLMKGFLYNKNWEFLSDSDLDKFTIGYGIDINLNRNQKIIEIVKIQNCIFQELLDKGYSNVTRDCPVLKKFIQHIDEEGNISIDSEYR